jgi:hypothetical protein
VKGRVRMTKYFVHINETRITKPVKIVLKRGGRGIRKNNRGGAFDQSAVCMCGNITMKALCTINIC